MTALVATWQSGLTVVGATRSHELPGQAVLALAADGRGGALAIVAGNSLRRRAPDGTWTTLATSEHPLSCCLAAAATDDGDDSIYVGTDDACVLRLEDGQLRELGGFRAVPGRDSWYAGSAVIDGKRVGPPLGVRSISSAPGVLLANVHVGGIPRSIDGGATWQPTIAIDSDVHEVRTHPDLPGVVVAAAAVGLCSSRDGGLTWQVESEGLHASYCSAVAFAGDLVLVSAATDHFADDGAVYARPISGGPLVRILSVGGIADTGCIAARGATIAVADRHGTLHLSVDGGRSWSRPADGLPGPSALLLV